MDMIVKERTLNFTFTAQDKGIVEGYGSVFGNIDSSGDIVEKGAFKRLFNKKTYPMLWQHNREQPIGVWEEFYEDEKGLRVKGRLLIDDIPLAKEAYALLKNNVINGLSIGYYPNHGFYDTENNYHIDDLELYEVSLVTFPANYKATIIEVKSDLTIRDAEKALVSVGFSHKVAKEILAKGFKTATVRDEQTEVQRDVDKEILSMLNSIKNIF
jgi:hypothetical protein